MIDQKFKQRSGVGRVARVDYALLDAGVFQPVDQLANVVTVLCPGVVPRLILGEPLVSEFVQSVADELVEHRLRDRLGLIDPGEHDVGRVALGLDASGGPRPSDNQLVEVAVAGFVDALQSRLDSAFCFQCNHDAPLLGECEFEVAFVDM